MEKNIGFALKVMEADSPESWDEKVSSPLPSEWVKTRKGPGGTQLDYLEGHRVIQMLSDASGRRFSFFVAESTIQESYPRAIRIRNQRGFFDPVMEVHCPSCSKPYRYVKAYGMNHSTCSHCQAQWPVSLYPGEPVTEPQPPVAHVLGVLVVPGVGVVSQWGSKTLLGGADEQESAFKAATTDAFKKCATLLGIGLELYDKDEPASGSSQQPPAPPVQAQAAPPRAAVAQAPAQVQAATPAPAPQQSQSQATPVQYPPEEVERMNKLREMLGIPRDNRAALNPLVTSWSGGKLTSYAQITPQNIKEFNDFMESLLHGAQTAS